MGAMRRSVQLDVIRALAILLVIGAHFRIAAPEGLVGSFAWVWHEWGGFGVPLFFTLSGYLVGGLLISEVRHGDINVSRFLIRRGLKIWPAYFVFLGYLVIMSLLKGTAPLSDFWPNVLFLQNYVGPAPALHTWSLAVEEHFYLALPFLLLLFVRKAAWIAPVCLLAPVLWIAIRSCCALAGDPYLADQTMPATHLWLDGLLVGVGIRAVAEFYPKAFAKLRAWRWVLIAIGVVTIASLAMPWPSLNDVSLYRILPVRAVSSTALLIGFLHLSMTAWWHTAMAWIGQYSYSIYLWHVSVLGFLHKAISPLVGTSSVRWIMAAVAVTASAVLFGVVMSKLVEWPVLRLRDRAFPSPIKIEGGK